MKTNDHKEKTDIRSRVFRACDIDYVSEVFAELGIHTTDQILNMRIFDLMNMDRISRDRAESMTYALYRYFNCDPGTDRAMRDGSMKQPFDYASWRKNHSDYSRLLVRDLVLAEDMNASALAHLFNLTAKAFFKSAEYDWHRYRYKDFDEYLQLRNTRTEGGASL